MKLQTWIAAMAIAATVSGCDVISHGFCAPNCTSQIHNTSSLVNFLYPDGKTPPPTDTIPELHVPLRIGLAFLPSQHAYGPSPLTAAQQESLLQQIKERFSTRKFISEIIVIPDYYLANTKGYSGLEGVQRLYNVDLMALVSYDQVTHNDDNKLSLGYLTIVGAFVLPGTSHDTATLVDLAVMDPATRSLVIRAGGTSASHGSSTLVDIDRDSRRASAIGFNEATSQMIGNFDSALTAFQTNVRNGRANVKVVARNGTAGGSGGGGTGLLELLTLCLLVVCRIRKVVRQGATQVSGTSSQIALAPAGLHQLRRQSERELALFVNLPQ